MKKEKSFSRHILTLVQFIEVFARRDLLRAQKPCLIGTIIPQRLILRRPWQEIFVAVPGMCKSLRRLSLQPRGFMDRRAERWHIR